ncbi:MAG: glutathione S-transferase N-terminal domain-containing protein [Deltaproteobacteria bacterium]
MPKLTYFDIRGRAEVIRLILEETGTPYLERRIREQEWAAIKPTLPFGQVPLDEEGELRIPQSNPCCARSAPRGSAPRRCCSDFSVLSRCAAPCPEACSVSTSGGPAHLLRSMV